MDRRGFLGLSVATGAATLVPRWMMAQAAPDRATQMRTAAASTPIKTTKLAGNVYLLQGAGGNMVAQTGPDGKLLIDSSFSTATAKLKAALDALGNDPASLLINTHWHIDHTDGNAGMHEAGFRILSHVKTRERLSKPSVLQLFNMHLPAAPAAALPVMTFDDEMSIWHNGDQLKLGHFAPAHTDSDIFIHFANADVLHVADTWFNGMYPIIDEGTGGRIDGMIHANERALAMAGTQTKIVPGHGALGTKAQLEQFCDMLRGVREKVAALKKSGATEQEAIAKKPTAEFDAVWAKGALTPDVFAGIVYRTI